MRVLIMLAGVGMLLTSAVSLSQVQPGQVLWGDIKTGMSKAEVKALYPGMVTELSDGCRADIQLDFEKKRVSVVTLSHSATSKSATCGTVMLTSLKDKYGEPRTDQNITQVADTSCFNKLSCALRDAMLIADPDPNTYWQVVTWFTGDRLIKLFRDRETDNWRIEYYQARLAKPEAAPKL